MREAMVKLDLHIHSNCSDGSDNWKMILQKAEKLDLEYISITDHNNCNVYFRMKDAEKYFSGKIIKGIEPECMYRGRLIELLGYGIDARKMRESLGGLYRSAEEMLRIEYERLYAACVKSGIRFSANVFEGWDRKKHYYPGCYLHEDLKRYPENRTIITDDESWGNSIQFFRNYGNNPSSPLYADLSDCYPTAKEIVKLIKQAGGKVFIPHIFLYGEDSVLFLEGLISEFQIDGVECFYNSFTPEQTNFLLRFCKKNNLLVSAGSDYHGSGRPDIKLGISDARLKDLVKWLSKV